MVFGSGDGSCAYAAEVIGTNPIVMGLPAASHAVATPSPALAPVTAPLAILAVLTELLPRLTDFTALGQFFRALFTPGTGAVYSGIYYLRNYAAVLVLGAFFSTDTSSFLYAKVREHRAVRIVLMLALFLVCVAYLVDSTYNPFLYFRF